MTETELKPNDLRCNTMRAAILMTLAFNVLLSARAAEPTPKLCPLEIAIASSKASFRSLESVDIDVIVSNTSTTPFRLDRMEFFRQYEVTITGPNHKPVGQTANGRAFIGSSERSEGVIEANRERRQKVESLNLFYDMSLTGEYTIVVSAKNFVTDGYGRIKSNEMKIQIEEEWSLKQREAQQKMMKEKKEKAEAEKQAQKDAKEQF